VLDFAAAVDGEHEFTNATGAAELKARIEAYWRARGHDVQVMLVEGAFTQALRSGRFDVRSDLVNGLPRGKRGGR
jgi:hypothetical protein